MTKNDGNFLILSSNDWNAIWVTSQEDNAKIDYLQTFHEKNVEIFSIIILKWHALQFKFVVGRIFLCFLRSSKLQLSDNKIWFGVQVTFIINVENTHIA